MEIFRKLDNKETLEFQQWARENYKPREEINEAWHPVVREECALMNVEFRENQEKQINRIRAKVVDVLYMNSSDIPHHIYVSNAEHIVNIGTSILCTKWGVGAPGGSFAQAVADDSLSRAFGCADDINQHCIKFYAKLVYNTSYVS